MCITAAEAQMQGLLNQHRATHDRPPLRLSAILCDAALDHAVDMANHGYFSHTGRDGRSADDRIDDAGYPGHVWTGENIAAGYATARETYLQWINSPPHQENILNPNFGEMGIARATGGPYGFVWVLTLGGAHTAEALVCGSTPPAPPLAPPKPAPAPPKPPRPKKRRRRWRRIFRRIFGNQE